MRNRHRTVPMLLFLLATVTATAAEFPPMDHAGADLTLPNGSVIWGTHTGIHHLTIPDGAVVTVKPYDGATSSVLGQVSLTADDITLSGTLTATGSGYTGGAGGVGSAYYPGHSTTPGNSSVGSCGAAPGCGMKYSGSYSLSTGGRGDGIAGGAGGTGASFYYPGCSCFDVPQYPPAPGQDGGYGRTAATNDDDTTGESVQMGGGGGGKGQASPITPTNPNMGGGPGGGIIRLVPLQSLVLHPQAVLESNGAWGQTNGDSFPPSTSGCPTCTIQGGRGAGGGICIDLRQLADVATFVPETGCIIRCLGAGDQFSNAGTVKILLPDGVLTSPTPPDIRAARTYVSQPTTAVTNWRQY